MVKYWWVTSTSMSISESMFVCHAQGGFSSCCVPCRALLVINLESVVECGILSVILTCYLHFLHYISIECF